MTEKYIRHLKNKAKIIKKKNNPENKTLMQIQHQITKEEGYKNWSELLKNVTKE